MFDGRRNVNVNVNVSTPHDDPRTQIRTKGRRARTKGHPPALEESTVVGYFTALRARCKMCIRPYLSEPETRSTFSTVLAPVYDSTVMVTCALIAAWFVAEMDARSPGKLMTTRSGSAEPPGGDGAEVDDSGVCTGVGGAVGDVVGLHVIPQHVVWHTNRTVCRSSSPDEPMQQCKTSQSSTSSAAHCDRRTGVPRS